MRDLPNPPSVPDIRCSLREIILLRVGAERVGLGGSQAVADVDDVEIGNLCYTFGFNVVESNVLTFRLGYVLRLADQGDVEGSELARVRVEMGAAFDLEEDLDIDLDSQRIQQFGSSTVFWCVHPYVRELVDSLASRMNVSSPLIPLLSPVHVLEQMIKVQPDDPSAERG